ncbi:hypothetical protein [Sphingomonas montana]|uniref:hypothetical protein n=1 Tax=Sphingomonas montana TaxID=1843236 RepID=UPI00096D4596|nr:hypothetical protein [Sphingomonas montana]
MIVVALLLSALAGQPAGTDDRSAYDRAFEEGFRGAFRPHFIESCVASAKPAVAVKVDMTPICTCMADRMLATRTVAQLKQPIPADEQQALALDCIRAHPPQPAAARP